MKVLLILNSFGKEYLISQKLSLYKQLPEGGWGKIFILFKMGVFDIILSQKPLLNFGFVQNVKKHISY